MSVCYQSLQSGSLRIGFDGLIGDLGIGRYIAGLLPALAEILGDRLVVVARRPDVAIVRALTAGRGGHSLQRPPLPDRGAVDLPLKLAQAKLALVHFPHYNLPIAFPGRFVTTIHDLFSFRFPDIHSA